MSRVKVQVIAYIDGHRRQVTSASSVPSGRVRKDVRKSLAAKKTSFYVADNGQLMRGTGPPPGGKLQATYSNPLSNVLADLVWHADEFFLILTSEEEGEPRTWAFPPGQWPRLEVTGRND